MSNSTNLAVAALTLFLFLIGMMTLINPQKKRLKLK